MDIEVVTNLQGFAALREEWNDLLSRSSTKHIFLTHEWQYTWWKHFGTGDKDLLILLVRDGGRLVGIAPLRRDVLRVRGLPLLRVVSFLVGYEADYRDFLIESGLEWDVLQIIFACLKDQVTTWRLLVLRGIHGDSLLNHLLPAVSRSKGLQYYGEISGVCPFIPLIAPAPSPAATMSGSARREYGRKLRKMGREQGDVELEVHRGEQVTPRELDEFLRLHALSWQGRGGSKAITGEELRLFHHDLIRSMRETDWPIVSILTLNGAPFAIIYGYAYDGIFYDYLPGFDPSLQKYSPGAQIIMKMVEFGVRDGWREFDLLRGDEEYKFHFTRRVRHLANHYIARSPWVLKMVRLLEAVAG